MQFIDVGPNPVEQLATQMAHLAKLHSDTLTKLVEAQAKKLEEKWEGQLKQLEKQKEDQNKLIDENIAQLEEAQTNDRATMMKQAEKIAQLEEMLTNDRAKLKQIELESNNEALMKLLNDQALKMAQLEEAQTNDRATMIEKIAQLEEMLTDDRAKLKQLELESNNNEALTGQMNELNATMGKLEEALKQMQNEKEEQQKLMDEKLAQLEEEQIEHQCQMEELKELVTEQGEKLAKIEEKQSNVNEEQAKKLEEVKEQVEEHAVKLAKIEEEKQANLDEKQSNVNEEQAKKLEQFTAVKERVEELEQKMKLREEKEEMTEYARLISAPNMASLAGNYDRWKMLKLIGHGNGVTKSIYIQRNQRLRDDGLLQGIVDLLAGTDKPEEMVERVTIECHNYSFDWPQNEKLELKQRKSNVSIPINDESENAKISPGRYLAQYELANGGSRFRVLIFHWMEEHFDKWVEKFSYRRLPDDLESEEMQPVEVEEVI